VRAAATAGELTTGTPTGAGYEAGYDAHATARWVAEPPKRAGRSAFERDRARVLHSASLRRLAAKTQVVAVGDADFPRTRLTHSLECAQIGRGIGAAIGCDPDLVETACLAHDIGHPPFGHNGEMALADLAAGCGGFEGNAQTLRLLTRLETKVRGAGLNLTRASLDATLKYPWPAPPGPPGGGTAPSIGDVPAPPKFNYYADDADVFGWIRRGAPGRRRCLEAQVMDWADDVAYCVHDVEDGLHAGLITFAQLHDHAERALVARVAQRFYAQPGATSAAELTAVFDDLMALDCWPKSFDGGPDALAALKNLTSELVGRFCVAAQDATRLSCRDANGGCGGYGGYGAPGRRSNGQDPGARGQGLTRYACDLVVPRAQRLECALLKAVAAQYVMTRAGVAAAQARERELIAELAAAVESGAPETLDPLFRPSWDAAASDSARRRVVIDQIASLTDTSAIAWHRRLAVPAGWPSRGAGRPGRLAVPGC
jgi:dGTPase